MRMRYTLKRAVKPSEDIRTDQNIIEYVRKTAQNKHPREFVEQDLGTEPIPARDFLFKQLEI